MTPTGPNQGKHHRITFEHETEGAAFVAALSRFLSSPAGSPYLAHAVAVEVRSRPLPDGGLELYLSDSALEAATAVFSPVPVVETISSAALPEASTLTIQGTVSAWGLNDAQKHLTGRSNEPLTAPRSRFR